MGAFDDARELAAGRPRPGRAHVIGQLLGIDEVTQRASVSIDGSQPISLPYVPGVYAGYTTVLCLCNPSAGGRAEYVLAPVGTQAEPPAPPVPPSGAASSATILPTSTGTWRTNRVAWDRYTGGDGALSDLYQGPAASGGGTLVGLATYGEQLVGLGAAAITAVEVAVTRVGTGSSDPVALVVQGAPHGSRPAGAPTPAGDTAQVVLARGKSGVIALPASVCEQMRTGAVKALVLVGAAYAGAKGINRGDGMALHVTYTRPA